MTEMRFGGRCQKHIAIMPCEQCAAERQPMTPSNNTTELLARWEARALNAAPVDSMIVNRHIRELREALAAPAVKESLTAAQPSPAAVERKPLTDDQIEDLRGDANRGYNIEREDYFKAFRDAESAHGIKAQQGEKT